MIKLTASSKYKGSLEMTSDCVCHLRLGDEDQVEVEGVEGFRHLVVILELVLTPHDLSTSCPEVLV